MKGEGRVECRHVEARSAEQALEEARRAGTVGADAGQRYAWEGGHGMVPRPRGLEAFFDELISQIDSKVILATHRLGYKIPNDMLKRLIDRYEDKIIAVNFSQAEASYVIDMHDAFGHQVKIYSGGTQWAITNMGFGGYGFNSSETNVMPNTGMAVVEAFRRGDVAIAVEAHSQMLRLSRLFDILLPATPRPMKTLLQLLGLPGGRPRTPYLTP